MLAVSGDGKVAKDSPPGAIARPLAATWYSRRSETINLLSSGAFT